MTVKQVGPITGADVRDRKPILWTIFGTLLGLVLLYAATRQVDAETLMATLRTADLKWSLGALAVTVGFVATKARRWGSLLCFIPNLKFGKLLAAVYVGLAVNFLIAHVGEFLRALIIARACRVSVNAVFTTVVVERVLDFMALLILLAVFSMFASDMPDFVKIVRVITGSIVVVALAGLYAFLNPPHWLTGLVIKASRPLPGKFRNWCIEQFERSRDGLAALQDLRVMVNVIFVSVIQWSFVVAQIVCSVVAVGESVTIVSIAATFVLIIVGLSLPNSPMQLGTTQVAFTIGLSAAGTTATAAVAASFVYTFFSIIPTMLVGGVFMLQNRKTVSTNVQTFDVGKK